MGFRNNADAVIARAEALERENKALRKKIAERNDLDDVEAENEVLRDELKQLRDADDKRKADDEAIAAEDKARKQDLAAKAKAKAAKTKKKAKAAKATARKLRRDNRRLKGTLGERMSEQKRNILVSIAFVATIVGAVFALIQCQKRDPHWSNPVIKRVRLLPSSGKGGTVSVLFSHDWITGFGKNRRSKTHTRLASFDLSSGHHNKTITLFEPTKGFTSSSFKLYWPVGDRAWAKHPVRGLELIDLRGPRVLLRKQDLESKLGAISTYKVIGTTVAGTAVSIVQSNGDKRWIDMTPALLMKPPKAAPVQPTFKCANRWGLTPSCGQQRCIGFARMHEGTTAFQLGTSAPGHSRKPPVVAGPAASALLQPRLLRKLNTSCAFEQKGNVLVSHVDTVDMPSKDKRQPSMLLSMVDRTGKIIWTVRHAQLSPTARKVIGAVAHDGGTYVVLKELRKGASFAFISAQGKIVATHELTPSNDD